MLRKYNRGHRFKCNRSDIVNDEQKTINYEHTNCLIAIGLIFKMPLRFSPKKEAAGK